MSRCLNFEFCNNKKSKIHPNEAFCIDCGNWSGFGYGWGKLTFIRDKEECSVCFETSRKKVMFPTNCGHSFCFDCTKNILIFNFTLVYTLILQYSSMFTIYQTLNLKLHKLK